MFARNIQDAARCRECNGVHLRMKQNTRCRRSRVKNGVISELSKAYLSPMNVIDIIIGSVATHALVDTRAAILVICLQVCLHLNKVLTPPSGLSLSNLSAHPIEPVHSGTARVVILDAR